MIHRYLPNTQHRNGRCTVLTTVPFSNKITAVPCCSVKQFSFGRKPGRNSEAEANLCAYSAIKQVALVTEPNQERIHPLDFPGQVAVTKPSLIRFTHKLANSPNASIHWSRHLLKNIYRICKKRELWLCSFQELPRIYINQNPRGF